MRQRAEGSDRNSFLVSLDDRPFLQTVLLVTLALAGGILVTFRPEFPVWEYLASPLGGLTVAAALAMAACVWRWPATGPVLLSLLVFTNLSQVLVREQGLPSLLQPFILLLVLTALRQPTDRWRRVAALPLTTLLVLVVSWLLASSLWSRDPQLADLRALEGVKSLVIYFVLAGIAATGLLIRRSAWAMVGGAALLSGLGVFQTFTGRFDLEFGGLARIKDAQIYGDVFEPRIAGSLGDPNFFAQVLLLALPIAVALSWTSRRLPSRVLGLGAALLIGLAVLFSYSRGAGIALGCQLLIALLFYRRRGLVLVAGLALISASLLVVPDQFTRRLTSVRQLLPGSDEVLDPDSSFEERRLYTLSAWKMFQDHPLIGVGAGNYTVHFQDYGSRVGTPLRAYDDPDRPKFPHSLYLEIGAETGVVGLLLFLAVIVAALWSLTTSRRTLVCADQHDLAALAFALQISIVGYVVSSLFLHGHFQRYLWLLFGLCGALSLVHGRLGQEARSSAETPEDRG